jgi:hypothetical protein
MAQRIEELEITIKTFLYDLDANDNKYGEVCKNSLLWMQVAAFRKLVSEV